MRSYLIGRCFRLRGLIHFSLVQLDHFTLLTHRHKFKIQSNYSANKQNLNGAAFRRNQLTRSQENNVALDKQSARQVDNSAISQRPLNTDARGEGTMGVKEVPWLPYIITNTSCARSSHEESARTKKYKKAFTFEESENGACLVKVFTLSQVVIPAEERHIPRQ